MWSPETRAPPSHPIPSPVGWDPARPCHLTSGPRSSADSGFDFQMRRWNHGCGPPVLHGSGGEVGHPHQVELWQRIGHGQEALVRAHARTRGAHGGAQLAGPGGGRAHGGVAVWGWRVRLGGGRAGTVAAGPRGGADALARRAERRAGRRRAPSLSGGRAGARGTRLSGVAQTDTGSDPLAPASHVMVTCDSSPTTNATR